MFVRLPHCDKVFMTYFDRWYTPDDRKRKGLPATRPDVMTTAELRGRSSREVSPLTEDGQSKIGKMVDKMIDAARGDWPTFLPVSEPIDIGWIDAFDKFHDRDCVKALMKASKPDDFANDFLVRCGEFGAVLGHVLLTTQPNLHWVYDQPYWESYVFDPDVGQIVPVFHWSIKKFSSYGIDDGFKGKLLACSEMIERERAGQPGAGPYR